jgi:DNA-binding MarR family transcriptional regulator
MAETEPRWLDDDEKDVWILLQAVFMRVPVALDAQLQRDASLSQFEYQILSGISMTPRRAMRMSTIAQYAEGTLPRLSQAVGRLEKRGYVERSPDPDDGRYTVATLTEAGWAKVVQTAPGHVGKVRELVFDSLTKAQQRQLYEICRRLLDAADPEKPFPGRLFEEIPDDRLRSERRSSPGG